MAPDTAPVYIAGQPIGPGHPVFIVAELSANHGQNYDTAVALIKAAKAAGADAVKLQTYTPDTITIDCDAAIFRHGKSSLWKDRTLYDLYKDAYTSWQWHPGLKQVADQIGICLFSSPFDSTAVDLLEQLQVPAYKIASFEIVDLPLIQRVAITGKPLIISTGMASRAEIDEALQAARKAGAREIILLQCTSAYPAPPEEMHLRTLPHMQATYGRPCGLSDHTQGTTIPMAAVCLGACLIEKHFTLSRQNGSPDAAFSLEPSEFAQMVKAIRTVEKALGQVHYGPKAHEQQSLGFRRSLFVVEDIQAGEVFSNRNLRSIRPGQGLAPKYLPAILGKRARCELRKGTPLGWDHVNLHDSRR